MAQTPAGSSTTNNNRTKSQKHRKVIIGDRLYEVDSLRDVEFLLKRIVREEVGADWSGLWGQLASQDRAYADLLVKAIVRQEEEDIESLLLLI